MARGTHGTPALIYLCLFCNSVRIDYDKFQAVVHQKDAAPFTAQDYMAPTPTWAVYGAKERGFDPLQDRTKTKGKNPKLNTEIPEETAQQCCTPGRTTCCREQDLQSLPSPDTFSSSDMSGQTCCHQTSMSSEPCCQASS
jgi:hypothetical protein